MNAVRITLTSILLILWWSAGAIATPFPHATTMIADTVYVSQDQNTYLVFDEPVEDFDLGGEINFAQQLEDQNVVYTKSFAAKADLNTVYVKALRDSCRETTLYIQAGNTVFVGILCYKPRIDRVLYDLREKTLHKAASYNRENYVPEVGIELMEERLYTL